jgi:hypothetical protein
MAPFGEGCRAVAGIEINISCKCNILAMTLEPAHVGRGTPMKLIEKTVADGYAQLLYADHPNKDNASERIEFKVRTNGGGSRQTTEMQAVLQIRAAFDEQMERIRREAAPPESGSGTLPD